MSLSQKFIDENSKQELLAQERYTDCENLMISMGYPKEDVHRIYSKFYTLWQLTQGCKRYQKELQEVFLLEPIPELFVREFLDEATDTIAAYGKLEIPLMFRAFLEKIEESRS